MTTLETLSPLALDGEGLTLADVRRVAVDHQPVALTPRSREAMDRSRAYVAKLLEEDRVVYGITTGFGYFKNRRIPQDAVEALQHNLLRSHAAGVGTALPTDVVRAMLLLRANALAKGYSGVRPLVVDLLVELINRRVHPQIPSQGSVGASGDLAPLSHLALVLIGEGFAELDGEILPGAVALERAGLEPIQLSAKEGLALINGTQAMAGIGSLVLEQARNLAKLADIACSMTLEATLGSNRAYLDFFHQVRPHPGQMTSARNLMRLTEGSGLIASHAGCDRVQDAYSLRCAPQVHGASRDALEYATRVFEIELNAATDNPLIFPDHDEVLTGGHFHGQPLALAMDFTAIALAEFASISERRTERLVNAAYSNGLPMFLAEEGGLNSGYMIIQYTAASLVSENKVLSHPACVDSIPTSAGQEDHVSMGTTSARKARTVLANVEHVLAVEFLCAAQGLDFRQPLKPGAGAHAAHKAIRRRVDHLSTDRYAREDIDRMVAMIRDGSLLQAVEAALGPLE